MYICIYMNRTHTCMYKFNNNNNDTVIILTITIHKYYDTPGLHNKIPAHKIFARVWVAQKSLLFIGSG